MGDFFSVFFFFVGGGGGFIFKWGVGNPWGHSFWWGQGFKKNHAPPPLTPLWETLVSIVVIFRWGTHLYVTFSICLSICPSVHLSATHHISGTVHHLIIILVHICKMMISPWVFLIFVKFWFLGLLWG